MFVAGVIAIAIAVACGSSDGSQPTILDDDAGTATDDRPDATIDDDDTPTDAGRIDGAVCLTPCDGTCCPSGQGCADDGTGKRSCVPTCFTGKDCASGCCAPAVNKAGNPVGPYVCMPDDTKAYHCCTTNFKSCPGEEFCCISDTQGNQFCAQTCTANAQCGAAHCVGGKTGFGSTCVATLFCQP